MKKLLLTFTAVSAFFAAQSQVIFRVDAPVAIGGTYNFTWADPGGGDWGTPDFNLPNMYVEDTLMLVTDSLACSPISQDLTGKIAVVYRGSCEFGTKAFDAQNAGAVGVVIINNTAGAPIEMGGGAQGLNVNIPVAMISESDGATIRAQMDAGTDVLVFFGNKTGQFANDLGFYAGDMLVPKFASNSVLTSQDASEYSFMVGSMVHNYGSADQTAVTLTANVDFGGSSVYNEVSTAQTIVAGDSAYILLPDFSLPTYATGKYTLTYTISDGVATEEFGGDNTYSVDFYIDPNIITRAQIDETTGLPTGDGGSRPIDPGEYSMCMVYRDPNGSRLLVDGMYINTLMHSASVDPLNGQEIALFVFRWEDQFTDLNDANFGFNNLVQIGGGLYYYPSTGDYDGVTVYAPFDDQVVLTDNERYLFCAQTAEDSLYFSFGDIDYEANRAEELQPYYVLNAGGTYYTGFSGTFTSPVIGIQTYDQAMLNVNELDAMNVTAYPNPAKDEVSVEVDTDGTGVIRVTDVSGKVVITQSATFNGKKTTVDLSGLQAGMYIFNVEMENGSNAQFNVVKQ